MNLDRHLLVLALFFGAIIPATAATESSAAAYLAGAAGLIAIQERLRSEFPRAIALVTTLVIFGGTSLFWSMTRATSFVDTVAFAFVAALLLLVDRLLIGRVFVWGLIAALPLFVRYLARPPWDASLFSSAQGFLSLTPVAYVALVGTIAYIRRSAISGIGALAALTLWIAADAAGVFAPRAASSPTPLNHGLTAALATLAPGLAYVIERARQRPLLAMVPLITLALAWNYWLMVQYTTGLLPKDAPVSFADMVRQQADVHTASPYAYPFTFPANVWFAWRERVPIDRYELLSSEPRRTSLDLAMDRNVDRFLLDGWHAPGPDDLGPVHWIGEPRATIALPLDMPNDRSTEVVVTARARLEEPAVNAEIGVELNGNELGRFIVPPTKPTEFRLTIPAATVGRILRAGYNRLTFVSYGVQRADPGDQRPGPPAGRSGGRAWPVAIYRIRIAPTS